jgi:hypothetical protein
MASLIYDWRSKRSLPIDPQVVGEELERLGSPTAHEILDAAASPDSPLHPAFEWDDTKAAHQYRLVQARDLVRRLVIKSETIAGTSTTQVLPAYINVPPSGEDASNDGTSGRYVSILSLTEDQAARAIRQLHGQVAGLENTLQSIAATTPDRTKQKTVAKMQTHLGEVRALAGTLS